MICWKFSKKKTKLRNWYFSKIDIDIWNIIIFFDVMLRIIFTNLMKLTIMIIENVKIIIFRVFIEISRVFIEIFCMFIETFRVYIDNLLKSLNLRFFI